MIVLAGIAVIALGFLLRLNPLAVVGGIGADHGARCRVGPGRDSRAVRARFHDTRYVTAVYMLLPAIGLLERYGLQARAQAIIAGFARITAGRLLLAYLAFRQVTAAIGLISLAGPAQTVRPLLAPMAEEAARRQGLAATMRMAASGCARSAPRPTISGYSSGRTSSSRSARSC